MTTLADKKISEMTPTTTIGNADLIPTVQGGVNKYILGSNARTELGIFTDTGTVAKLRTPRNIDLQAQNILNAGNTTSSTFQSTIITGTAPLTVASTTVITNLNADLLDGLHASELTDPSVPFKISNFEFTNENSLYPKAVTFAGTNRTANDEASLIAAIAASTTGDIVTITADITLTATLIINKSIKLDGAFILQSAGSGADPVTLISVTANNVYITSNVTIKHRKTTNTSVECAISLAATGFVSEATIEYMEFGYVLRGSFNISGDGTYTGALGNNHRHFAVYNVSAPSIIQNVIYDFPSEATPRNSFIYLSSNVGTDLFDSTLKVLNCYPYDKTKISRQFYLQDAFVSSTGNPSLIFENCYFNDLNGGIGLIGASGQQTLDFFTTTGIAILGCTQGTAGTASYKGLLYIDGSGALHNLGTCPLYYAANNHLTNVRTDYTTAYDNGGICYKNTVYNTPTLNIIYNVYSENNNVYNYIQPFRSLYNNDFIGNAKITNSTANADLSPLNVLVPNLTNGNRVYIKTGISDLSNYSALLYHKEATAVASYTKVLNFQSGAGVLVYDDGHIDITTNGAVNPTVDINLIVGASGAVRVPTRSQGDNSTAAASTAYVDAAVGAENLWDRTLTTLSPHTANDSVNIGTGLYTGGNLAITNNVTGSQNIATFLAPLAGTGSGGTLRNLIGLNENNCFFSGYQANLTNQDYGSFGVLSTIGGLQCEIRMFGTYNTSLGGLIQAITYNNNPFEVITDQTSVDGYGLKVTSSLGIGNGITQKNIFGYGMSNNIAITYTSNATAATRVGKLLMTEGGANISLYGDGAIGLSGVATYVSAPSFTAGSNQLASVKYVDDAVGAENLWDRVGTTLIPHTANDSVNIGTGAFSGGSISLTGLAESPNPLLKLTATSTTSAALMMFEMYGSATTTDPYTTFGRMGRNENNCIRFDSFWSDPNDTPDLTAVGIKISAYYDGFPLGNLFIDGNRQLNVDCLMAAYKSAPTFTAGSNQIPSVLYVDTGDSATIKYFGSSTVDGSWRIDGSSTNMVIQRRESGSWVTKATITAA